MEIVDINRLKDMKILYKNDFYQYAKVVIKMMDAYDHFERKQGKTVGMTRPTIYGLARKFATTANIYFSDQYVLDILKKHGFSGKEMLDMKGL